MTSAPESLETTQTESIPVGSYDSAGGNEDADSDGWEGEGGERGTGATRMRIASYW